MKNIRKLFAVASLLAAATASAGPNEGVVAADLPVGGASSNSGQVLCTAAVNSDGTIAGNNKVSSVTHLGVGQYEVIFKSPCTSITAAKGWSRWVQPDTLTTGAVTPGFACTTADRAGNANGVFVYCGLNGVATDTSFFLFVAR